MFELRFSASLAVPWCPRRSHHHRSWSGGVAISHAAGSGCRPHRLPFARGGSYRITPDRPQTTSWYRSHSVADVTIGSKINATDNVLKTAACGFVDTCGCLSLLCESQNESFHPSHDSLDHRGIGTSRHNMAEMVCGC